MMTDFRAFRLSHFRTLRQSLSWSNLTRPHCDSAQRMRDSAHKGSSSANRSVTHVRIRRKEADEL